MSILPSTATIGIGATFSVTIRENSLTDPVNATQMYLTYDPTKVEYLGTDGTGSAFSLDAASSTAVGSVSMARSTAGGVAAVTGDNLVVTVNFKALAVGVSTMNLGVGTVLVRSSDAVDILAVKNGTTITVADVTAPTVPTGLVAANKTMTSIGLGWVASTDNVAVTGYKVFRNGVLAGVSATPTYTDAGLTAATAYNYTVAAYDLAGNNSAQSGALSASTLGDTAPPSVPGVPTSATQTMTSISLAWPASSDNVAVAGYRLYRNGTMVVAQAGLVYTDVSLALNTSYSYTVAAYDAAGNMSAQSTALAVKTLADTQAPTVPAGVSGTATGQTVNLAWLVSTDNVAVAGYSVYRDGVRLGTSTATTYADAAVVPGVHSYTVTAADGSGNVSAQSAAFTVQVYQAADLNRDGKVNVFDLSQLLSNWSSTGTGTVTGDLNGDKTVNVFDLSILLTKWTG
jgi:chitodextrinase